MKVTQMLSMNRVTESELIAVTLSSKMFPAKFLYMLNINNVQRMPFSYDKIHQN